jgi:hypothetical protein
MEPTPTTAPQPAGPPAAGGGLVEFVRGSRQNAGLGLLALAALFVAGAVVLAYKAFGGPAPKAPDQPLDQKADPLRPDAKPPAETEAQAAARNQYNVGWVACLAAAVAAATAGGWLVARPAPPGEAGQRAEARVLILAAGTALGVLLILAGVSYFYLWSDSLTAWLNRGEVRESRWVLYPILMVVAGAGLVFLAIQPARAEERNSQTVRKAVYRANAALTVLLLVVALVVANVAFALKVPNKIDATATGFFSLSDPTKALLSRLAEPVTATAVLFDMGDRQANDIRQLLLACEDASGGKFRVRFLSDVADRSELSALQRKYPQLDLVLNQRAMAEDEQPGAVLLTTGEGEKRHAVIPAREFSTTEGRQRVFAGEARLFKELAFLADSQARPVVYFTQGSGELALDPGPTVPAARAAGRLKKYLQDSYVTVLPLDLTAADPAVPAEAAVVVVADPTGVVPAPGVAALRKYMADRKGRLIVLAGTHTGPDRKVLPNGLDPLLADLNVKLGNRFLFSIIPQTGATDSVVAAFAAAAEENPVLQAIIKVSPRMTLRLAREVNPQPTAGGPGLEAKELMVSTGLNWAEDEDPTDLGAVANEMRDNRQVLERKGLGNNRPVAAIVSDGPTGRAVVIGSSYFVSDDAARRTRAAAPLSFDLVGMSVDWLREKTTSTAAAGIESKKYSEYRFPQPTAVDETRLKSLPLGLAFLAVVGLGTAVWVVRRK